MQKSRNVGCKYYIEELVLYSHPAAVSREALPGNLSILPPKPDKSEVSPEDAPIMLPIHLHEPLRKLHKKVHGLEDEAPGNIRLSASSIVLSTNKFGDFSKCSIISEMITEETLQQLEKEVPILWQRFIHQPQTGRCLVFLLLLGRLCQAIALEHQEAVNYLMAIINIEVSYLPQYTCNFSIHLLTSSGLLLAGEAGLANRPECDWKIATRSLEPRVFVQATEHFSRISGDNKRGQECSFLPNKRGAVPLKSVPSILTFEGSWKS